MAKYFLWVKVRRCFNCGDKIDLFPGYLVARDSRHPENVVVCHGCGELVEIAALDAIGSCGHCGKSLVLDGPARRNRCKCPSCGVENRYPKSESGPPEHRMFAIEYHCPACKHEHKGRFFKRPDESDLETVRESKRRWNAMRVRFVPSEAIADGDETHRLKRWGYSSYRDLFSLRQLLGLELSCRLIARQFDKTVRNALATNLSDLLRYQNMLCRYDTTALKSLDIFSIHGFPVGLIACESNLLRNSRRGKRFQCWQWWLVEHH